MENHDYDVIIMRLSKLERHNKWLRFWLIALVAAMISLGTIAWRVADEYIHYKGRYTLLDESGIQKGGLGVSSADKGALWLGTSELGVVKPGIVLDHDNQGMPYLGLYDYQGQARVLLDSDMNYMPRLVFYDISGKVRAAIGSSDNGTFNIWLFDRYGRTTWQAVR